MTLRAKLFLSQAPLVVALLVVGWVSFHAAQSLGESSQAILKDNYRSVLAAQRMKEFAERIDSASLFLVAGADREGVAQAERYQPRFEDELRTQESNITEHGEREATTRLRSAWERYKETFRELSSLAPAVRRSFYFDRLQIRFEEVKDGADAILNLNQDAMNVKSDFAQREAKGVRMLLFGVTVASFALGLFSAAWLIRRMLHPLSSLTNAARRVAEGDLSTRATVTGHDEIAVLAMEFNRMAEHLGEYRRSSLGELLQAQQASQAAIDSLPDPVLVFDHAGHILSSNNAAESLLSTLGPVSNEAVASLQPELREGIEVVRRHIAEGHGTYHPKGYEESIRITGRESDRYFVPRGTPVYGESGDVVGVTVLLQDVTRLRRFDELKNDLVATVAHEMKTPLTSLHMAIYVCLDQGIGSLNDKQADLLFAAREDCERLQSTVDEILDLARIQSGRVELQKTELLAKDVVLQAIETHQSEILERRLNIDFGYFGVVRVWADPERVQLVIGNLLSNAVKYSNEGATIRIWIEEKADHVRFSVIDQGPGIDKEEQSRIFEKFFRAASSGPGGAGLGLYIAREIVQAHGGQIGLESEPGRGSTFWFTLPKAS